MPFTIRARRTTGLALVGRLICACVLTFSLSKTPIQAANNSYIVTDLGPVLSTGDSGKDINNLGVAAYTSSTAVFLWQNGAGSQVNNLFANNGPLAINDLGHLAGAENLRAYIYRNGAATDLGMFGTSGNTFAEDLNNSDVVVGYDYDNIRYRAFMWQNGIMTELTVPNMTQSTASTALAINDLGQVAGETNGQAIVWNQGTAAFLDGLADYSSSIAVGINASGQVIGNCDTSDYRRQQAVIWTGTTPTSLGGLGDRTYTSALGINDLGEIVGSATYGSGDGRSLAFLWMDGQMIDLNTLLPSGSPWLLLSANAINNAGQIVGYGTANGAFRSFLLTPVPEPTAALAAVSIFGLLLRRQRANGST